MSKARDIASAIPAPSTVSSTELGYLDGVTSAIQTQIDSKAPSSTAVTLTDTQTLTNKTLTNPVIASVVNNTLTSTTGDMIYASAANTPARLGIGSSAQVLTVASGVPSWATPSSGAKLISRTTFSASSSVTVDSLFSATYENYLVCIQALSSVGNTDLQMRGRYSSTTHTGANYQFGFSGVNTSTTTARVSQNYDVTQWTLGLLSSNYNLANLTFYRQNSASQITYSGNLVNRHNGYMMSGGGFIESAQTWTGLFIFPASGTITGQISVYGLAAA